jgi:hypothetical protein
MSDEQLLQYGTAPPRRRRWPWIVLALAVIVPCVVVATPVVLIVGWWVVRDYTPPDSFADQVRDDLAIVAPAHVTQLNASRRSSGMDPACYYELSITEDAGAFIEQLKTAAKSQGWRVGTGDKSTYMFQAAPAWWMLPNSPDTVHLRLYDGRPAGNGYHIIYVPGSSRVFVFWYNT